MALLVASAPPIQPFPHRFDHFSVYVHPATDDPAEAQKIVDWGREKWQALQPYMDQAVYINGIEDALAEGQERVRGSLWLELSAADGVEEADMTRQLPLGKSEYPSLTWQQLPSGSFTYGKAIGRGHVLMQRRRSPVERARRSRWPRSSAHPSPASSLGGQGAEIDPMQNTYPRRTPGNPQNSATPVP